MEQEAEKKKPKEPDVLQYTNYRVYLRDYYDFKKHSSAAFSLRFFAEKAGLSSHAHLKLVIDGKRNITKNTVIKLITGIGLDSQRAVYFECLVFFNQATTEKEKQVFYAQLLKASPRSKLRKLEDTQFRIFKEWFHTVILEMVALNDFKTAPEWVSKRLVKKVTPTQVTESLKLLSELGLLVKTANGFRRQDSHLTTDDEVRSILVKNYHEEMIRQAEHALSVIPAAERDISSLTFGIRRKDFPALKKHLQLMRKELLDFSVESGEAEEVIQVNLQLFPLTKGI